MKKVALGILSVMLVLAFAACGDKGNDGEKTSDWESAFAEGNFANYKVTITTVWDDEVEADAIPDVLSVDGKKFKLADGALESYMSEEDGKIYEYSKMNDVWTKTDITENANVSAYSFQFLKDGESDFTQADGWYVCKDDKFMTYARALLGKGETPDGVTGTFKLKLQNKKLAELVVDMTYEGESVVRKYAFSDYGKVTVTLPTVTETPEA